MRVGHPGLPRVCTRVAGPGPPMAIGMQAAGMRVQGPGAAVPPKSARAATPGKVPWAKKTSLWWSHISASTVYLPSGAAHWQPPRARRSTCQPVRQGDVPRVPPTHCGCGRRPAAQEHRRPLPGGLGSLSGRFESSRGWWGRGWRLWKLRGLVRGAVTRVL